MVVSFHLLVRFAPIDAAVIVVAVLLIVLTIAGYWKPSGATSRSPLRWILRSPDSEASNLLVRA